MEKKSLMVSLLEYSTILVFLIFSLILSLILFGLSYILASQTSGVEKLSAYECGFNPFEDVLTYFDVRFYLVVILFMIFNLEVKEFGSEPFGKKTSLWLYI